MELKFRAWNKSAKRHSKPFTLNCTDDDGLSVIKSLTNEIVERFIGLKDDNGIEIYEGDILQYYNRYSEKTYTHIVGWDDDLACFALFEKNNKWQKESDWIKIEKLKVIGNIHNS